MLRILICFFCFITVAYICVPNALKSQFMKNNDRKITLVLHIILLALVLYQLFT